jgi:hypothetical protein
MTYDAFTDTSYFDKIDVIDYLMLAFTILLLIPWVVLPIWGIVSLVKWIKSKKQHINMKETAKVAKESCDVKENISYHETRIEVSARILEIRIVKQHKTRRVNNIPVSDYKRRYLVTLGYAGLKSTVTGFRRYKDLKKGDKIEATLVSRHYQNGRTVRKLIIQ